MWLPGAVLDLVLPQRCVGCGAAGGPSCAACAARLTGPARCRPPRPAPPGLPPPWAVAPYDGAVRRLIVAYKERGRAGLAGPLGAALARSVLAAAAVPPAWFDRRAGGVPARPDPPVLARSAPTSPPRPLVAASRPRASGSPVRVPATPLLLVPVPSSRASVRRRGDDPTLRLARVAAGAATRLGIPARCLPVLAHRRRVADQAGLAATERLANLRGALTARRDLRGTRLIVVDDVVTTGATLAEAARALRAAGAEVHAAAVVAATPRRYETAILGLADGV